MAEPIGADGAAEQPTVSIRKQRLPGDATGQWDPHDGTQPDSVDAPSPEDPMALPLDRLGGYRIIGVLGRGGMGVVYEAEDEQLGRRVALKVMAPSLTDPDVARQRFLREARSMAAVEHDNIIPVYGIGEDNGQPFIAMPLLAGETLTARLARQVQIPLGECLTIAQQTALALTAAHLKGLVHRDVKPSNIWLESYEDGTFRRVRLLDFGLTRPTTDAQLTASGVTLGTPHYIAPEQARGYRIDHRADLFSLGCVLYEMLTGTPPFQGRDPGSILVAVIRDDPPDLQQLSPDLPLALTLLVGQLLEKEPEDRPATARLVAEELTQILLQHTLGPHSSPDQNLSGIRIPPLQPVAEAAAPPRTPPAPPAASGLPPEVQLLAWILNFPGATVRVRGPESLHTITDPKAITGNGSLVHTIVVPEARTLTDSRIEQLALFPRLRGLWLANTQITNFGLQRLAQLPFTNTLTVFGLPFSLITSEAFEYLRAFRTVSTLDLSGTKLSPEGLAALCQWIATGAIPCRRIRLRGIPLEVATVAQIQTQLPHCVLEWDGSESTSGTA